MVRCLALSLENRIYFRDLVRTSRMLFESLRNLFETEKSKRTNTGDKVKETPAHIRDATMMRQKELWLNRDKRIIGNIPGVYVGDVFFYRIEMCVLGLLGQVEAGIDYISASMTTTKEPVATNIVVSGGYEDGEDKGNVIIFTGQGGRQKCGKQSVDQKLQRGNLALERSKFYGIEIRLIRGVKSIGRQSKKVYVYDGLYKVVESWFEPGKSGFSVCEFKLVRMNDEHGMGSDIIRFTMEIGINPRAPRQNGYLSLDISNGEENIPVFLFNNIDEDKTPLLYEYLLKPVYSPFIIQAIGNGGIGCSCNHDHGWLGDCYCARKSGGEFAYDSNGKLVRGKPLIYECGPFCRCPPTCQNRVCQKGMKHILEIFRSMQTGWGVRPLELKPAGSFVSEYTGVAQSKEQATVLSMDGSYLVYPSQFPKRWTEWGDVSKIFTDSNRPVYPTLPLLDFTMNVDVKRNVASYISHSSSTNLLAQFVIYDHKNVLYPHLVFFAIENIPSLRDLCIDYGVNEH